MTDNTQTAKRDIPLWLSIAVIFIGAIAAGWYIWAQVAGFSSAPSGTFTIPIGGTPRQPPVAGTPSPAGNPGAVVIQPSRRSSAIWQVKDGAWRLRSAPFFLDAARAGDRYAVTLSANSMRALPTDAQWLFISRMRLDDSAIASIGLTPEQAKEFKALPVHMVQPLQLEPQQQQELETLFKKCMDTPEANRAGAEAELTAAVAKSGQAQLPKLKQQLQDRYDGYKKTVTPQQWEQLKALASATTQPAV